MPETKAPITVPQSETNLPVLPLRDVVVFPHMVIPLFVGRRKSIRALEQAMESGKQIMLVAQKSASDDDPAPDNIHTVGTIASILQLLKLPDGTVKVLVEGERRAVLQSTWILKTISQHKSRCSRPCRSPIKRVKR
jgi:ATP-dependent Lon protease